MSAIDAELRPAWRTYWLGFLIAGVLLLAAVGSVWRGSGTATEIAAGACLVGAVLVLAVVVIKRFSWKFTIDDNRVTRHYGLIARNQQSVRIRDLRSVELDQGILQRIFGVGDLAFYSSGSAEAEVRFSGIAGPAAWRDEIARVWDRLPKSG